MVKIKLTVLFLAFIICLCSCGLQKHSDKSFFVGDFSCEYSYLVGGKTLRARLVSRKSENGREEILSFFEPESLFGFVCIRGSGGVDVSFEGLDITVD